jgi:hypothetical protein
MAHYPGLDGGPVRVFAAELDDLIESTPEL